MGNSWEVVHGLSLPKCAVMSRVLAVSLRTMNLPLKKTLAIGLTVIGLLTHGTTVQAAPVSALSPSTEVAVAEVSKSLLDPAAYPLAKSSTLVTWVEGFDSVYSLQSKVVSATNKVGKIFSITPANTATKKITDVPVIATNAQGNFFAAWIAEEVVAGNKSQKVFGRFSKDGISWSAIFPITSSLVVNGEDCTAFTFNPGCGFENLIPALDQSGRFAIIVTDTRKTDGVLQYRVSATKNTKSWPALKLLGTDLGGWVEPEIVGLQAGFAVAYQTGVNSANKNINVSYFDPKTNTWLSAQVARSLVAESVIDATWVQRDAKTLSLITIPEGGEGGILVKNFDLTTKKFTSFSVIAQPSVPDIAFQNTMALAYGNNLVIMYTMIDQVSQASSLQVAMQTGVAGIFTRATVLPNALTNPIFFGVNKANYPVMILREFEMGTRVITLSGNTEIATISNTSDDGYLISMALTKTNLAVGTGAVYDEASGTSYLFLIKGQLK